MSGKLRKRVRSLLAGFLYNSGVSKLWWVFASRARNRKLVCVLGLHRVLADDDCRDSHSQGAIVLRTQTFTKLLEYLKEHFALLPGDALFSPQALGPAPKPYCVVTFDDGWIDSYTDALPELRRVGVPATLLVATSYLGSDQTFWVERLRAALAGPRADHVRAQLAALAGASLGIDEEAAIEYLKRMPSARRDEILHQLLGSAEAASSIDRMMTWEQLREMSDAGVEIGGHTSTHPLLTYESAETVRRELSESRQALQQRLGVKPQSFAYPNGDFDARVRQAVVDAGYACAYTTRSGWYTPGSDLFTVPRYLLHEGNVTGVDGEFSPAMFNFTIAGWRKG
jgi:peptidoglycan/xylan/chitin deacetylase (PgdA/CDA1 family)